MNVFLYTKLVSFILLACISFGSYGESKEDELSQIVTGLFQRSDELLNVMDLNIDSPQYSEYKYLNDLNNDLSINIRWAIDILVMFGLCNCAQENSKLYEYVINSLNNKIQEYELMNKRLLFISSKTKSPLVLDYANKIKADIEKSKIELTKYL